MLKEGPEWLSARLRGRAVPATGAVVAPSWGIVKRNNLPGAESVTRAPGRRKACARTGRDTCLRCDAGAGLTGVGVGARGPRLPGCSGELCARSLHLHISEVRGERLGGTVPGCGRSGVAGTPPPDPFH
ncbi:hypothetical protein NDU88_003041 [Pleurodeles waltl]|uniref:Uncharacterized protein n=1 Tax=Pleurodeles waltl TaxID=8319 RepID=A0AAV7UXC3_PLEWA|nr:hypothetical protein NDU88_003041 [Pleurodeles waltl]